MDDSIKTYNAAQTPPWRGICEKLASEIDRGLPRAESKIWHRTAVWFIDGNPIVGYAVRKANVQLLFWSGQSFGQPGLKPEGSFKAAQVLYTTAEQVKSSDMEKWLAKSEVVQWDYKNIVKRKGRLEKIGDW